MEGPLYDRDAVPTTGAHDSKWRLETHAFPATRERSHTYDTFLFSARDLPLLSRRSSIGRARIQRGFPHEF